MPDRFRRISRTCNPFILGDVFVPLRTLDAFFIAVGSYLVIASLRFHSDLLWLDIGKATTTLEGILLTAQPSYCDGLLTPKEWVRLR